MSDNDGRSACSVVSAHLNCQFQCSLFSAHLEGTGDNLAHPFPYLPLKATGDVITAGYTYDTSSSIRDHMYILQILHGLQLMNCLLLLEVDVWHLAVLLFLVLVLSIPNLRTVSGLIPNTRLSCHRVQLKHHVHNMQAPIMTSQEITTVYIYKCIVTPIVPWCNFRWHCYLRNTRDIYLNTFVPSHYWRHEPSAWAMASC